MTILASVVAAVGLHAGSSVALDVDADLSEPRVEANVGGSSAKVSGDGVDVKLDDGKDDDSTKKTKDETETATGSTGSSSGGSSGSSSSGGSSTGSSDGGSSDGGSSGSTQQEVRTAGEAESAPEASDSQGSEGSDVEEARRLLDAGSSSDADTPDRSVEPGIDLSPDGDAEEPVVADPRRGAEQDWEVASPDAADPRSDAELATVPYGPGDAIPPALKLLAAVLVAGTGTVWHLSNRRLSAVSRGLPTR